MSEEVQAPVEQADQASGETVESKDSVSLTSYQKVLKEKKSFQSRLSEYESKLQKLEEEKLHAEGKKEELLDSYKKRVQELESRLDKTNKSYAWNTLTGSIKTEAVKAGCKDPDKLIRLMDDEDLRSIEIGDNFTINTESLKEIIEKNKKENYFLFETTPRQASVGNPSKKSPEEPKKSFKDMTREELLEAYKQSKK
jgi:hypothetical protein